MDGSTDRACETTRRRRRATGLVAGGLAGGLALAAGLAVPAAAESAPAAAEGAPRTASVPATVTSAVGQPALTGAQRATLETYLEDTYTSLEAMTDEETGLPADNIEGDLDPASNSAYTSPTNIGGWLWSTVVARDLGLVDEAEARDRLATTIDTVASLDRHDASGMFYNWYDPATGDRVETWPDDGNPVHQFLSSVDNGWLAAGLRVVAEAEPSLAEEALAVYDGMHFGAFYNAEARPDLGVGLLRGGFWDEEPPGCSVAGDYLGTGTDVYYTCHNYDTTVSETRIATYLGIAEGEVPPEAYYASHRTFPDTCDWSWQEQKPIGETREHLGVPVFEGAYRYRDLAVVPGWGGSMFEALMPDMLVPEAEWGPTSWGVNHPLVVRAHKEHGLDEAGYGAWGFSPASNPFGGYAEYGVDAIGLRSDGYLSDGETDVDLGFEGCREATNPAPEFGDGVVTPHASFLGLAYDTEGVLDNLAHLADDLDAYGPGGFYDSVAVRSGTVAERYLSLDQAMIVAAIGNVLDDSRLKGYFVDDRLEQALRPLMEAETFSAVADLTPGVGADVEVEARCLGNRAAVAVRATSTSDGRTTVELATPYGTRSYDDVAPHRSTYRAFSARTAEIPSGTATVTVTSDDGATVQELPYRYAGVSCG